MSRRRWVMLGLLAAGVLAGLLVLRAHWPDTMPPAVPMGVRIR